MKYRGRKSRRETLLENNAADRYYATLAGIEPQVQSIVAPARKRSISSRSLKPLERDIQKAILAYLQRSPKIWWAARFNSGTFMDGERYIRANSQSGLSDILAMQRGTGRLLAIEVKRPGEKALPHQQAFLDRIAAGGGIGIVAHSVDDITEMLNTL